MHIIKWAVQMIGVFLCNSEVLMNWMPKYFGRNYYSILLASFILIRLSDTAINFSLFAQYGASFNASIGIYGFGWTYLILEQLFFSLIFYLITFKEFEFIQSSREGTFHANTQDHIITQKENGWNALNWAFIKRWFLYTCLRTFLIFSICSLFASIALNFELITFDLNFEQVKLFAIIIVLLANSFYLRRFIVQLRKAHIFA
jgi:hypothetical protein